MGLSYCRNKTAFSLLELIVGVAILSVGIVVVLQALSYSARMTGLSCDVVKAVFLAEDKIQELEFKERQNIINNELRFTSGGNDKFEWTYSLNPDADLRLYRLDVEITWIRVNREERLKLNTYLR